MTEEVIESKIELNYNDFNTIVDKKSIKDLTELLTRCILCGIENISQYNINKLEQKEPRIDPKHFYTFYDEFLGAKLDKVNQKPHPFTILAKCRSFIAFLLSIYVENEFNEDQQENNIKQIITEIIENNDISSISEYNRITSTEPIDAAIRSIKIDTMITLTSKMHISNPVRLAELTVKINNTFLQFIKILSYALADKVYNNGEKVTIYKTSQRKPREVKPKTTTTPRKVTPKEPKYKEGDEVHKGFSLSINDFYESIHRLIPVTSNNSKNFSYYVTVFTETIESRTKPAHTTKDGKQVKETKADWDFIDMFEEYIGMRNPSAKKSETTTTDNGVPTPQEVGES